MKDEINFETLRKNILKDALDYRLQDSDEDDIKFF